VSALRQMSFCFPPHGAENKKRGREIVRPWVQLTPSRSVIPGRDGVQPEQSLGLSSPHLQGRVSHHGRAFYH
jgi:hypothetical protein